MNQKYNFVIASVAITIAVIGISIQFMPSGPQQTEPKDSSLINEVEKTTSQLSEILPVRDNIGTAWKIFPASSTFGVTVANDVKKAALPSEKYLNQMKSSLQNAEGYQEGIAQLFWKNLGESDFVVNAWAFKFSSGNDAWFYYNDTVSKVYEEGGFEEYNTKRISGLCYGTVTPKLKGESYDHMNLYCVKSDIFYQIYAADAPQFTSQDKETVISFGDIIASKITPEVSISTDKHSYTLGDAIVISGSLKSVNHSQFTLQIFDPDRNLVQIMYPDVDQDGKYSVTLTPAGIMWKTSGIYTVIAEYGSTRGEANFEFMTPLLTPPDVIANSGVVGFYNVIGGGGQTQNRVYKQLTSALPIDSWVADFDYKFTYSSMVNHFLFALTNNSEDPERVSGENRILIYQGTNENKLTIDGPSSAAIPILPNTQYYVKLERTPTQLILSVFSDQARTTHVSGSPVKENILPTNFGNLRYIQHDGCSACGPARVLTAELDNTRIYDKESSGSKKILFEDSYSSDAGWTQIGSSITVNKLHSPNFELPKVMPSYLEGSYADIKYDIVGGKVISITPDIESRSALITIETRDDGVLIITLPRSMVDARIGNQDDSFFVLTDGNEVRFEELSTTYTDRTLSIPFKKGVEEIEIIGTSGFP